MRGGREMEGKREREGDREIERDRERNGSTLSGGRVEDCCKQGLSSGRRERGGCENLGQSATHMLTCAMPLLFPLSLSH
jgi:hypothetical protein